MRENQYRLSFGILFATVVLFVTMTVFSPMSAIAGPSVRPVKDQVHLAPESSTLTSGNIATGVPRATAKMPSWPKPTVVYARPRLNVSDELATLEAMRVGLTEVGDGASYVWHRRNGRLSGIVKPTMSFRDANGQVCRHLEVWLTTGYVTKKTEGIACRDDQGVWTLES